MQKVILFMLAIGLGIGMIVVDSHARSARMGELMTRPKVAVVVDANWGVDRCYQNVGWTSNTKFSRDERHEAFCKLNKLANIENLRPGQKVLVPVAD